MSHRDAMGYRKYSWIFESDPGNFHQTVPSWVAGSISRIPGSGGERVSVLYIDDEPDLLNLGKHFLERSGFLAVETAVSGEAGLKRLTKGKIDVIVSDYQMAGIDGIDVLKEIRKSGNATPFIIFTGKGREEVVIEALNEGADFYLQKGGDPKSQFAELEHKIFQAYRRQHAEREVLESRSLLSTVFESIADGILVIGSGRKIAAWNGQFLKMWQIPPECIEMRDLEPVLEIICSHILTPDSFLQQMNRISSQPDLIRRDIFLTNDGRIFEWYLQPQWIGNEILGGILSFRDVTARMPERQL
ncbi:MAG: response regulator [Methanoregulaceae archaeon]